MTILPILDHRWLHIELRVSKKYNFYFEYFFIFPSYTGQEDRIFAFYVGYFLTHQKHLSREAKESIGRGTLGISLVSFLLLT